VRATLQLIDARTEENLWAESFDRDLTDILVLQSEVARAVANEVRVALTPEEGRRFASVRTVDREAYRTYLRAVRLSPWPTSEQNLETAKGLFETAIAVDPAFAPAYVGLSRTLLQLGLYFRRPSEVMPQAHAAAQKAVELDDGLSDTHAALGHVKLWWQWDWSGAEAELRRALDLSPSNAWANVRYAELLAILGQPDDAVSVMRRGVDLDPLNAHAHDRLGYIYFGTRRFDEGIEHLLSTLELYPNDPMAHFYLSWNYLGAGRYDDALSELKTAARLSPSLNDNPLYVATLATVYSSAGKSSQAAETARRLIKMSGSRYVPQSFLAWGGYLLIGDTDGAIKCLEKAFADRTPTMCLANIAPALDPFRSDPRFQDILRRMGYPRADP